MIEALKATLTRGFDFDFAYEDVARQRMALRRANKKPIRIRISSDQWNAFRACREILTSPGFTASPEPTFFGLTFRIDPKWDGPMVVECAGDGSELA